MIRIIKEHNPANVNYGITLDDLTEFLAEAHRAGIPGDTPVTEVKATFRLRLKQIGVEA